ncbi:peptidyl-prolyl cis-trans isomerase [Thermomonas brevis]
MLQKLRDKTTGWIATVILGLLIIPFAFFGMESYMSQRVDTHVARISQPPSWWPGAPKVWPLTYLWTEHDIQADAYRQRFEMARARARDEQGDAYDAKAFESADNKRRILDAMIDEQVMRIVAESDGIVIGDAQVRNAIQQFPDFQVDGAFNADRYQLLLSAQSPPQTPRQFEQTIRDSLLNSLIPDGLGRSAFITNAEVDRLMRLLGEHRDVSFVVMPEVAADTAEVTPAQVEAWYKANQNDYRSPETVRIEYIEVNGSALPPPLVDEAALRQRYAEQAEKYSSAEQRDVAHILVEVPANADAAAQKAAEARANKLAADARAPGADFAALARANSDDTGSKAQGGSLGWLAKGGMPGAFDEAVFAMQAGDVRGPVKSDFGWHVIQVKAVRGGEKRAFEDVREELAKELQDTGRERAFNELTGKLVDAVYRNPNSLEPAAQALGLQVHATPAFTRGNAPGIAAHAKVQQAAFSEALVEGRTASDPIEIGPEHTVMIRVMDHQPEKALPLAQAGDAVVRAIRADRQRKAAEAAADALVTAARAKGLAAAAAEATLAMGEANDLPRGGMVPSPEAVQAFFEAPRPENNQIPVDKVRLGNRFVVFAIRGVRDGDIGQVSPQERAQLRQQLSMAYGVQAQQSFVREARTRYKIDVAEDRL